MEEQLQKKFIQFYLNWKKKTDEEILLYLFNHHLHRSGKDTKGNIIGDKKIYENNRMKEYLKKFYKLSYESFLRIGLDADGDEFMIKASRYHDGKGRLTYELESCFTSLKNPNMILKQDSLLKPEGNQFGKFFLYFGIAEIKSNE